MDLALPRREPAALSRLFGAEGLLWWLLTPAVVMAAILRRPCAMAVDPDYWWHLAAGRWMLDHGRVATTDPFSFTHGGQSWYAHEWLGEVTFAAADKLGGYALNIVITAALLGAGFWLLWRAARCYGASTRTASLCVLGGGAFVVQGIAVRPQVWVFALLMAVVHELAAHDTGRRQRLWALPLLFALCINLNLLALHGGLMVAIYVAHRALRWWAAAGPARRYERARCLHALLAGALSALALCLNPRGPALLWFVRTYLDPHAAWLTQIQEWRPPPFSGYDVGLYALGGAAVGAVLYGMVRRRTLWPGLPVLIFAAMAARSQRYEPLLGISLVVAGAWLAQSFPLGRPAVPVAVRASTRPVMAAIVVMVAALSIWSGGHSQFHRVPDASLDPAYPVAAAAWLRANDPGVRLFANYGWGGYIDAAFYPHPNVFIDGRAEMFGAAVFDSYLNIEAVRPGWQATLAAWDVGAVLMAPNSALAHALAQDPGWRQAFAGSVAVVYVPVS